MQEVDGARCQDLLDLILPLRARQVYDQGVHERAVGVPRAVDSNGIGAEVLQELRKTSTSCAQLQGSEQASSTGTDWVDI